MAASNRKRMFLAASIAGLMTVSGSVIAANAHAAGVEGAPCYGINACKATGDCGGKASSCHGTNACKGQGWLQIPADLCTRIEGGRLTA